MSPLETLFFFSSASIVQTHVLAQHFTKQQRWHGMRQATFDTWRSSVQLDLADRQSRFFPFFYAVGRARARACARARVRACVRACVCVCVCVCVCAFSVVTKVIITYSGPISSFICDFEVSFPSDFGLKNISVPQVLVLRQRNRR